MYAQKSAQLPAGLNQALSVKDYDPVIWLDSARPVWGNTSTEAQRLQIQQVLAPCYFLKQQRSLVGTSSLDNFSLYRYARQPNFP